MDITVFVTWFIDQVAKIFSWFFSMLASIEFCGTNLLVVLTTITILGALLPVILTLSQNVSVVATRSERVKERIDSKNEKK